MVMRTGTARPLHSGLQPKIESHQTRARLYVIRGGLLYRLKPVNLQDQCIPDTEHGVFIEVRVIREK